jgi:pimeloyl-ACP methyl ester carboxylesterase
VNNFFIIGPLWRNFTRTLVQRNRILTYDLRNQGASSAGPSPVTFQQHVDDLADLLDGLGIDRTYLLGTSISTVICRDFALAYPDRVQGLILVGPVFGAFGARRRKYHTRSWLRTLELGGPEALFDQLYPLVYDDRTIEHGGTPAYVLLRERFLALNSYAQLHENLSATQDTVDDPAKLGGIECPTLLLAGDGDFIISRSSLDATADRIPRCSVQILSFAAHVPYFEATDAFEESV